MTATIDLTSLAAAEAVAAMARGEISAERYVGAFLDRIVAIDKEVGAFIHLDAEYALAQARARDAERSRGGILGPLHGIPVALKDIVDTKDYPTENGSPLFAGRRPHSDATVAARLRAAGAVIIGKTVTTELAYFHPGKTRNPRDLSRTPGGSSSGSAAAVAAGMVPFALGSQTNGSMIRPAAFCGVYGIKPSHGLVSRAGVLALSRTLDHIGAYARSLEDLALVLEVMAGYDPADPDTRPLAAPHFGDILAGTPPAAPRFAFVRTPIWDKADPATRAAFEALVARLGGAVESVELPAAFADAWPAQRAIMATEMAHHFGELVARAQPDAASGVLRALLDEGATVPAVRYIAACETGRRLAAALADVFARYDAIITPATIGVAPKGQQATGDPAFCTLWTLTGVPALSLPLLDGENGLPLGVQLVGAAGDDGRLLRHARVLVDMLDVGRRVIRPAF
jgi:Asp-tRNA(Asn)/Glu-tRNA(Gln) amidotransferase A subunit family amidase